MWPVRKGRGTQGLQPWCLSWQLTQWQTSGVTGITGEEQFQGVGACIKGKYEQMVKQTCGAPER